MKILIFTFLHPCIHKSILKICKRQIKYQEKKVQECTFYSLSTERDKAKQQKYLVLSKIAQKERFIDILTTP